MKRLLLVGLGLLMLGAADIRQANQDPGKNPANQDEVPPPPKLQGFAPVQPQVPGQFGGQFQNQPSQYKDAIPAMIEALKDDDGVVRQYAAATLVAVGREAVPALLDVMKGKDNEARANAAYVLGQMGQAAQEAMPVLLKAMKDEDKSVRRRAAFALHRLVTDSRDGHGMPGMPGMMGGGMGGPRASRSAVLDPGLVLPDGRPSPAELRKKAPAIPPADDTKK